MNPSKDPGGGGDESRSNDSVPLPESAVTCDVSEETVTARNVAAQRFVPMTLNVSEFDLNRFQGLLDQFLNAMSVARLVNLMPRQDNDVKVTDVKEDLKEDIKEEDKVDAREKVNVTSKRSVHEEPIMQLRASQPRPGCSKDLDTSIVIRGSSSDEKAKPNRFFRPRVQPSEDSSDDETDMTHQTVRKKLIMDDSELSEDFLVPSLHKKMIQSLGKGQKRGQAQRHKYFLRPPKSSSSSSEVDDVSPLKGSQPGRTAKAKMLAAMSAYFSKTSKAKGTKKQKVDVLEVEGKGKDTPTKPQKGESEDDDPYRGRCSICLEKPPNCLLRCRHLYCEDCCRKFKRAKKACPKCQKRFRTWETVFF